MKKERPKMKLPNGVCVGEKPIDIELSMRRNADRWQPIIDALKDLASTECVQVGLNGAVKNKINGMKYSLIRYAKQVGFKEKIKFAVKDDILYIW